jgi:hypothetical protein
VKKNVLREIIAEDLKGRGITEAPPIRSASAGPTVRSASAEPTIHGEWRRCCDSTAASR